MIRATYHRRHHRLTVTGHARSAEEGRDLVCAGASTLALTLASAVADLVEKGQASEPVLRLDKGDAEICCRSANRFKAVVTLIFDTVCGGFELLATQYPEYIFYEIRQ